MSEFDKNFDNFNFLRSSLIQFPTEVCKYWILGSIFVERLPIFWLQNNSNGTQVAQKRRCWNFSTSFESFWSVFEAKRCNVLSSKKVMYSSFFFVFSLLSWLCWNWEQNSSKIVQKMHQKRQQLQIFRQFSVNLSHFSFKNWTYLALEAQRNNKFPML